MQLYLAPLQGITDWIFREAFFTHIAQFDKTFSPFIRIEQGEFLRKSQCNDILPQHNTFQKPIPQFLGNDSKSFKVFEELCKLHGYSEVNINIGCPFSKVSKHKLGSGLLPYANDIKQLFDDIFSTSTLTISVKCRLGQEHASEFDALIPIFNSYPLHEIIIHARTGYMQYKGDVLLDEYSQAASQLKHPVCYNGDILNIHDIKKLQLISPHTQACMIGRGIIKHPFLLHEIRGILVSKSEQIDALRAFHTAILEYCSQKYSGDFSVLKRLEEMWTLHHEAYDDGKKILKQVKKCRNIAQYKNILFSNLESIL